MTPLALLSYSSGNTTGGFPKGQNERSNVLGYKAQVRTRVLKTEKGAERQRPFLLPSSLAQLPGDWSARHKSILESVPPKTGQNIWRIGVPQRNSSLRPSL